MDSLQYLHQQGCNKLLKLLLKSKKGLYQIFICPATVHTSFSGMMCVLSTALLDLADTPLLPSLNLGNGNCYDLIWHLVSQLFLFWMFEVEWTVLRKKESLQIIFASGRAILGTSANLSISTGSWKVEIWMIDNMQFAKEECFWVQNCYSLETQITGNNVTLFNREVEIKTVCYIRALIDSLMK